jgi:hypothetical protein
MTPAHRRFARFCIWAALCFGLIIDGALVTGHGMEDCDWCPADVSLPNYLYAETWLVIGVLLLLQGVLIWALIRWRDPGPPRMSILQSGPSA